MLNKMARQIGPFALYLESMRNDQVDGIGVSATT
jgi:hypothetical protein